MATLASRGALDTPPRPSRSVMRAITASVLAASVLAASALAMSVLVASALAMSVLVSPSIAGAQAGCGADPDATAAELLDRARAALRADEANAPCELAGTDEGLDAECTARLDPAIADLERSIDCGPTLAAYNNLAVALLRQGRVLRALALFEAILRDEHGALSEAQRRAIEQQVERARRDLAMLEIATGAEHAEVRVDDRAVGATSAGEPVLQVMVDPGLRSVVAASGAHRTAAPVEVTLGRGDVRAVALALTEPIGCDCARDPSCCAPIEPPQETDPVPIVLGVVGAVVAVGVAAAIVGVYLSDPMLPGPVVPVPSTLLSF